MTFAIEMLPESERSTGGDRLASIRIGEFRERCVVVPLPGRRIESIRDEWRRELRRLLDEADAVALQTSPAEAWVLHRCGGRVTVQHHLLVADWDGARDADGRVLDVPARATTSAGGRAISEWETSTAAIRSFLEQADAEDRTVVGVVRGTVHRIEFPRRSAMALSAAAIVAFLVTGDWVHVGGVVMILLGAGGATPSLNVANGCLVWIAVVVATVIAWSAPSIGIPLALWGVSAWLVGSIECRLTMRPHEAYRGEVHAGGAAVYGVSLLAIIMLVLFVLALLGIAFRWSGAADVRLGRDAEPDESTMTDSMDLREHLLWLLRGGYAHIDLDGALADLPPELRGARAEAIPHTSWRLLEHMRIAQRDILEFSRRPDHVSPPHPDGYWPAQDGPLDDDEWTSSIAAFDSDAAEFQALVANPDNDLLAPSRGASGPSQTFVHRPSRHRRSWQDAATMAYPQ